MEQERNPEQIEAVDTEREERQARYEEMAASSKRMKKRILLIVGAAILAVAILALAVFLIDKYFNRGEEIPQYNYSFYLPYDGDIMENSAYLGLDRDVHYCNMPYGNGGMTTSVLPKENADEFDPKVLFLYDYIQTIIAGDAEKYNSYFNNVYFETSDPKDEFSQQMLHNITIYPRTEEKADDGSRLVTYRVDYMIYRNDGSFRDDVDSNAIRPQFISIRVSANGDMKIERIVTQYIK